jgi:hypothetical protein
MVDYQDGKPRSVDDHKPTWYSKFNGRSKHRLIIRMRLKIGCNVETVIRKRVRSKAGHILDLRYIKLLKKNEWKRRSDNIRTK